MTLDAEDIEAIARRTAELVRAQPDVDEVLPTEEAMGFMRYASAHRFLKAARRAGVFPISGARPFAFRRVDLLRWREAPKVPVLRVRVRSLPARNYKFQNSKSQMSGHAQARRPKPQIPKKAFAGAGGERGAGMR